VVAWVVEPQYRDSLLPNLGLPRPSFHLRVTTYEREMEEVDEAS